MILFRSNEWVEGAVLHSVVSSRNYLLQIFLCQLTISCLLCLGLLPIWMMREEKFLRCTHFVLPNQSEIHRWSKKMEDGLYCRVIWEVDNVVSIGVTHSSRTVRPLHDSSHYWTKFETRRVIFVGPIISWHARSCWFLLQHKKFHLARKDGYSDHNIWMDRPKNDAKTHCLILI